MLAYLMTEPELVLDGPLDESLDLGPDDDGLIAALAYEAAPDSAHRLARASRGYSPSQ